VSLPLIRLAEVDSTQSFLRRHPELGFCAVLADAQGEGRGRQGNAWISAPGAGLWLSAALPVLDIAPGLLLQKAMAAVIAELPPWGRGVKGPNDRLGVHQGRLVKLAGSRGERVGGRLILGLGVNLHAAPALPERAFPAACLADLLDAVPAAEALAFRVLEAWADLDAIPEPGLRWPLEGDPITWEAGRGVCLGWEPDGRLKVAAASGIERLSAADVRGLK